MTWHGPSAVGYSPRRSLLASLGGLLGAGSAPVGGGAATSLAAALAVGSPEEPLLPGDEEEEERFIEHLSEPKPWPALRGSSVSTRRISPSQGTLVQELAAIAEAASQQAQLAQQQQQQQEQQPPPALATAGYAGLPTGPAASPAARGQQRGVTAAPQRQAGWVGRAVVAGGIESIIALPLQLSFAAIIFRVRLFAECGCFIGRCLCFGS